MEGIQNYLVSWEEYESGDTGMSLSQGLGEVKEYLSIKFPDAYSNIYKELLESGIWFGEYFEVSMQKTNWADKTRLESQV